MLTEGGCTPSFIKGPRSDPGPVTFRSIDPPTAGSEHAATARQGLFPVIVLIVPRSPHEANYSHKDPDQPTGHKHVGRCLGITHFFAFSPMPTRPHVAALCGPAPSQFSISLPGCLQMTCFAEFHWRSRLS
jgi:hypothetical protein